MRSFVFGLLAVLWVGGLMAQATPAQTPAATETLRVATRVVPPLVIQDKDQLTGFSIDLWKAIADKLKVTTQFQVASDVPALLEAVKGKQADVGIAAISVTAERDQQFDFSQPILDSGLQILVRGTGGAGDTPNPLAGLLKILFSPVVLMWLGIAALLIIIPAHLMWWLERRRPDGIIPQNEPYIPGIYTALWWAASTLATQAEQMPRHWIGRVLAVLWMFTGVVFVAYYTAQLTASLTVQQIQGAINGPEDLPGKTVGTTKGSTSAAWLQQQHVATTPFETISDAYAALRNKTVDAVVFDSPVLLYYANHGGKGSVQVVGVPFRKEDYGIVFQTGSPLRKRVDGALLALREDGTYQALYDKWFGVEGGK